MKKFDRKAWAKQYYEEHEEEIKAKQRKWRQEHKEKLRIYMQQYRHKKKILKELANINKRQKEVKPC